MLDFILGLVKVVVILVIAAGLVGAIAFAISGRNDKEDKSTAKLLGAGSLILLVVFLAISAATIIETGERGVILRMGKLTGVMSEGLNFKAPLIDDVIKMNIRDNKYAVKLEVSSADMQTIAVETSLIYSLGEAQVGSIYQTYGANYEEVLIKPTLAEITNAVIAQYPIEQFVEKRAEISNKISQAFLEKTKDSGVIVKSLLITNHDFSDEYDKAIESKKVAEQNAMRAKYDLDRVTLEAEAQLKKQKSLNDLVLREKAIDKWDGKLPNYYSGDQLPFISGK